VHRPHQGDDADEVGQEEGDDEGEEGDDDVDDAPFPLLAEVVVEEE
jgi:hypothetical protein